MDEQSFDPVHTMGGAPGGSGAGEASQKYEDLVNCTTRFVRSLREKPGSCKKFAKAFPACYKKDRKVVEAASREFWEAFESRLVAAMQENNEKLRAGVERIERVGRDSKDTWRPSGHPEADMEAGIALSKQEELSQLEEMLQEEESEQRRLDRELGEKEQRIKDEMEVLQSRVRKWEEVRKTCESAMGN